MPHEELDRLLAEYATGGLSEEDKKKLFTAALADQELFEQLMEEDALREAIEMPGARNRLIDSLQEDLVMHEKAMASPAARSSVLRMPAPAAPQPPPRSNWLAWAAGIGIVFVSGAITYVIGPLLGPAPTMKDIAQVYSGAPKDTKPFVPPPQPAAAPRKVIVEEPPKIMAEARKPMPIARPVSIPLPAAPPPPEPVVADKEIKAPETFRAARAERDSSQADAGIDQQRMAAPPAPVPRQQAPAGAPATVARRQAAAETFSVSAGALGAVAKSEESRERKAKAATTPPSVWRQAGDGVWIRVPAADAINRTDTIAVRYTPLSSGTVALLDPNGRRVASKSGRAGEELELLIPPTLLQRSGGDTITVSITEGPRSTFLKILLRNP